MKNSNLTYLFLLLSSACLLYSCASETPSPEPGKSREVAFDVSDNTRASITTELNEFAVFGDMKFPANDAADPSVLFNNTKVEYINGKWTHGTVQYWFPQHEHSFVAIAPSAVLSPDNNPEYKNSQLSFSYTMPTSGYDNSVNHNDVSDILYATHRRLYDSNDVNSTIYFRFNHLMTLINIAPALSNKAFGADTYIQITKIEFTGLKNNATFKIQPAERLSNSQTDDRVIEVTDHEGETTMTIEFAEPKKIMNLAAGVSLFDANDAIIMLPQTFAADSQAEIIFTYTQNGDPEEATITCPLKLFNWEPGRSYTYKFTYNGLRLTLSETDIANWEDMKFESGASSAD